MATQFQVASSGPFKVSRLPCSPFFELASVTVVTNNYEASSARLLMPRLDGKVMIVTGDAMGIGAPVATHASHEGAKVVLIDIKDDTCRRT